jgi:C-terminal processing protease CtpA/Prc
MYRFCSITFSAFLVIAALTFTSFAQNFDRIEKGRMKDMLAAIKSEIKKNYYDPAYHGIDLDQKFSAAEQKLDAATSSSQALGVIAQVVIDFNDSHLYFVPPSTNIRVEYGWRMQMIGDKCYIVAVKPGSDAEAKGLKIGDELVAIGGFRPNRKELWKVRYYYNAIGKRDHLVLTVKSPGQDATRDLDIKSEIKRQPQVITYESVFRLFDDFYEEENDKHRFQVSGPIAIWKMPSFEFEPSQVDSLIDKIRGSGSLILDLRGNGGGYVKTMERLTGHLFDKEIKVAEMKGRKPMDPSIAKPVGTPYKGQLIVLVDSESGSASEIFARLVQLEKRGRVVGDVSSGSVMQSRFFEKEMGTQNIVMYGVSVTNADVIMSDGKSLEHVGVQPDEVVLPTGADLAADRDVALARAVELLGGQMTPEDAGKFFTYYWKK